MSTAYEHQRSEIMRSVRERCTALAEKLEQLHHKVIKPVEQAGEAVSSTVGTMAHTVSTARHVVDQVGEGLAKWPWLSLAGGLAAGLGTGLLISPAEPTTATLGEVDALPRKPGFLADQFNKLTGIAAGAGLAALRDLVKDHVPSLAGVADHLTDDLSRQLGATPYAAPILQPLDSFCESGI